MTKGHETLLYMMLQSESEVVQSCPTLCDPRDCIMPGSSLSMGCSRQEYWRGLPFPSPGDLPGSGTEPRSPTLQADALPSEPPGKPRVLGRFIKSVNPCTSILGGFLLNSLLRFSFLPSPLPSPFSLYHWDSSLPCFLLFLLELLLFMYQSS